MKTWNKKWYWSIGNGNDSTNFPHKSLLTDTQVSRICKALSNASLANKNFSKTQLPIITKSGVVIRDIPMFGNIPSSIAKKGTDIARSLENDFLDKEVGKFAEEHKIGEGSGVTLTNNEIKDTMKVIKSLKIEEFIKNNY